QWRPVPWPLHRLKSPCLHPPHIPICRHHRPQPHRAHKVPRRHVARIVHSQINPADPNSQDQRPRHHAHRHPLPTPPQVPHAQEDQRAVHHHRQHRVAARKRIARLMHERPRQGRPHPPEVQFQHRNQHPRSASRRQPHHRPPPQSSPP